MKTQILLLFFVFSFLINTKLEAQTLTPGGTNLTTELWLSADKLQPILPADSTEVNAWMDRSVNGINFQQYNSDRTPMFVYNGLNFHPALEFFTEMESGIGTIEERSTKLVSSDYFRTDRNKSYYTFWVSTVNAEQSNKLATVFNLTSSDSNSFGWNTDSDNPSVWSEGTTNRSAITHSIPSKTASGIGAAYLANSLNIPNKLYYNGISQSATVGRVIHDGTVPRFSIGTKNIRYGNYFYGQVQEIIILSAPVSSGLNQTEVDKVNSYLGIKYGITLDTDLEDPEVNTNYVLSNGSTTIWEGNAAPNKGFHNNIAGLVRDDTGGLFINKAKSSESGSIITMMDAGHTEEGQGDTSVLINNNSALYWGNNNEEGMVSLADDVDTYGEMDYKTNRMWLVNKTNLTDQEVSIRIRTANNGFFPYNSSASLVFFLVANSAEDLENNNWLHSIPAVFVNGEYQLEYRFTEEFTYFMLGVKDLEKACETENLKNEDGLVFIKEATKELLLCEEALFTFRIINTNYTPKTINFEDHLPDGMTWIGNSLSIDEDAYGENISSYANSKELILKDIKILGEETLLFQAKAMFSALATAGIYNTGRGKIEYKRMVNNVLTDIELVSYDRFAPGCDETKITANDVMNRPLPVELVSYGSASECYRKEETITVTITINNPNAFSIEEAIFGASYNEEFIYISESLTSTTISEISNLAIEENSIYIEELSIPTGEHSISFKIKSREKEHLIEEIDDYSEPISNRAEAIQYTPLEIEFEFKTNLTDVCMNTVLSGINGTIELSYCSDKKAIISNKMVTPKIKNR